MRLFQNSGIYKSYLHRLNRLALKAGSFNERIDIFLNDRFGAPHFLKPVLDGDPEAFFTNGDDEIAQRQWAKENGMSHSAALEDILLAQIEAHKTEVFYNADPITFATGFVKRLPGSVRHKVTWRAAPSGNIDISGYDFLLCNFPSILQDYANRGMKTAYFFPAHDPVLDDYSSNTDRPIDVLFVGGYSRHHLRRAAVLEAVASLRREFVVEFALDRSRITRLAESPFGLIGPLSRHRRPRDIVATSTVPVFGRELYERLSRAKIVLNGAIDMAGTDRGNMRCWEAMGAAALLVSDTGGYPEGFIPGRNFREYIAGADAASLIRYSLKKPIELRETAHAGNQMIRSRYCKAAQWRRFQEIVS